MLVLASFALTLLAPAVAQDPADPAKDPARERLEESPRHHEWVEVKREDRVVHAFVAFPEVKEKAPVVLVIHENKGLTDWVRSVADELAASGYVAIAPDLLSGKAPEGGRTDDFSSPDAATKALYALDPAEVMADLGAVADHALALDASSDKLFVAGFCWGGSQSFAFATERKDLAAAFVFYGGAPKNPAAIARIECPVYGFYGESDARINASLPETEKAMDEAGKTFEKHVYTGAGHGFMRAGEQPDTTQANRKARLDAWELWKDLLSAH